MSHGIPKSPNISALWGRPLQPAHCPKCDVAHLISPDLKHPICPACYSSCLEPQPTVIRPEPPELLLDFVMTHVQIKGHLKDWLQGVWLHPKELSPEKLAQRLSRTFIPLWLIDGKVCGTWQAQMGFDYQVASSQEVFRNGVWETRKRTETRIRWEPRTGTIDRTFRNLSIPALEEYNKLKRDLGRFKIKTASSYSPAFLEDASVRVPDLLPETAWPFAKSGFDLLAARDCQNASGGQHVDEFTLKAGYKDQIWTQLLLPVYTTAYQDDSGRLHPILINGQNGKIFGTKRASQRLAGYWSLGLGLVGLVCFFLGLLFAAGTVFLPLLAAFSFVSFASALFIGIMAPIPALWAWNFNRSQDE